MSKLLRQVELSSAKAEAFADGARPSVEVYAAVGGGYVYTYVGTFSGHGYYAGEFGEVPYATVEAAVAAGLDICASGEAVGPGADAGEFDGEVA